MQTTQVTPEQLAGSVIAVPPMARDQSLKVCPTQNERIIQHIEAGGVQILLYGGNAVFYHISLAEYGDTLETLAKLAASDTLVIPSIGPAFGFMMDQVNILREFDYPTAMILPQREIATSAGIATGVRLAAERFGRPIVLYLKHDRNMDVHDVQSLVDDGCVSFIKYAVVLEDTAVDPYLSELLERVDRKLFVSGIGEQPAIIHLRDFGLQGFTSGCVCIAPALSMQMLHAIRAKDFENAESIRQMFVPLEDLRNRINPIRVLHDAVTLSGIANAGPILPLLTHASEAEQTSILEATRQLLKR